MAGSVKSPNVGANIARNNLSVIPIPPGSGSISAPTDIRHCNIRISIIEVPRKWNDQYTMTVIKNNISLCNIDRIITLKIN